MSGDHPVDAPADLSADVGHHAGQGPDRPHLVVLSLLDPRLSRLAFSRGSVAPGPAADRGLHLFDHWRHSGRMAAKPVRENGHARLQGTLRSDVCLRLLQPADAVCRRRDEYVGRRRPAEPGHGRVTRAGRPTSTPRRPTSFQAALWAAVIGIAGMAGSVLGTLFSLSAGRILQLTGSYNSLFILAGSVYMVAFVCLQIFATRLKLLTRVNVRHANGESV